MRALDSVDPKLVDPKTDQRLPQSQLRVFQSPEKRRFVFCLLLALTIIAIYNPVTRAPFLNYDDVVYVTDNSQVRAGVTWKTVAWAFETSEASNWHPLTWLSHALDCQIFGLNPMGPHTVNVFLHTANAILLFLLLDAATGFAWRSLFVVALFALHPINVESVAWISERKSVLSVFFFLLALAAYGWYARRPGVARYLSVTFAFALGLMTKPQVITFPFAVLLLDYWPLRRVDETATHLPAANVGVSCDSEPAVERPSTSISRWSLIGEKAPWLAMSAISAIITMRVQTEAIHTRLPLWIHCGNAALAYVKYLGKFFWPVDLAPVYPHPELSLSVGAAALSALAIIGVSSVVTIFRDRRPYLVGWFWFLGTLVPMIGLVQVGVQAMADRYAYIPFLGLFIIAVWGAADLVKVGLVPPVLAKAAAAVLVLALGLGLHRQVGFWGDNLTLWTHTLAITEGNYIAEDNLATALIAQGRAEEAMPHLQRARSLRPDDPNATLNIASLEQMQGNYQAALEGYAKVLQFTKNPYWVTASLLNGGYAHYSLKQYGNAQQNFEAVLARQPRNASAYRGLGLVAQKAGNLEAAAKYFRYSVELQPSPVGYLLLAQALESEGQREAALAAQSQAAQMTQDLSGSAAAVKQLLPDQVAE